VIRLHPAAAVGAILLLTAQASNAEQCQINLVAELPITMKDSQPTIVAKINGSEARFIMDSGAFYSMMSSATAEQYSLKPAPRLYTLTIRGVGGVQKAQVTVVKNFTLAGLSVQNIEFIVAGRRRHGWALGPKFPGEL
jgi:Aspartyl protease